jgi:hypothetical protein
MAKAKKPGGTPEGRQRRRWRHAALKNAVSKIAILAHQEARRRWPTIAEAQTDANRWSEMVARRGKPQIAVVLEQWKQLDEACHALG